MTENERPQAGESAAHAPPSALNIFANPIIRRYRRSQMRPVRLGVAIIVTLVIAGFIATLVYLPLRYRAGYSEIDAARAAFVPLLIYQAIILMVFGTAAIGGGILRESEEGMIEYQRLTPLSPLSKVLGYLFGLPARQYFAFGIAAIFSAFSIVVGKIPFVAWGSVYLVLFSSAILYHLLGLVTGLLIKTRWRAGLISIGLVLVLNLVLPRLAEFGFVLFSHFTVWPVVGAHLGDLVPAGWISGRIRLGPADVPFWGMRMSHLAFCLLVQGSLAVTFVLMLVRRWRDEQAHLLGKGYALGSLLWLQVILLGNVLPLLDSGRVFSGMFGAHTDLARAFRRLPGHLESYILGVLYGVISLFILVPIISCMTPRESTQMVAFRRRKKLGERRIPWLTDGATAAPFVWVGAGLTGTAWAVFVERLFTSRAFDGRGFPVEGWAMFIGITLVVSAIFHFLLEGYGRRPAWLTLFLAGFLPLFTSLVLISVSGEWLETAKYLVGLSPLSAPWQPLQALDQMRLASLAGGSASAGADFGPFILFCAAHAAVFAVLFIAWRRRRRLREARA